MVDPAAGSAGQGQDAGQVRREPGRSLLGLFRPGEVVSGRVVEQVAPGTWAITVRGRTLVAESAVALRADTVVQLEVMQEADGQLRVRLAPEDARGGAGVDAVAIRLQALGLADSPAARLVLAAFEQAGAPLVPARLQAALAALQTLGEDAAAPAAEARQTAPAPLRTAAAPPQAAPLPPATAPAPPAPAPSTVPPAANRSGPMPSPVPVPMAPPPQDGPPTPTPALREPGPGPAAAARPAAAATGGAAPGLAPAASAPGPARTPATAPATEATPAAATPRMGASGGVSFVAAPSMPPAGAPDPRPLPPPGAPGPRPAPTASSPAPQPAPAPGAPVPAAARTFQPPAAPGDSPLPSPPAGGADAAIATRPTPGAASPPATSPAPAPTRPPVAAAIPPSVRSTPSPAATTAPAPAARPPTTAELLVQAHARLAASNLPATPALVGLAMQALRPETPAPAAAWQALAETARRLPQDDPAGVRLRAALDRLPAADIPDPASGGARAVLRALVLAGARLAAPDLAAGNAAAQPAGRATPAGGSRETAPAPATAPTPSDTGQPIAEEPLRRRLAAVATALPWDDPVLAASAPPDERREARAAVAEATVRTAREAAAQEVFRPRDLDDYDHVLPLALRCGDLPTPARLAVATRATAGGGKAAWLRVDAELSELGPVSVRLGAADGGPVAITVVAHAPAARLLAEGLPELVADLHALGLTAAVRIALPGEEDGDGLG